MAETPKRLTGGSFGGIFGTGANETLYTVPALTVTLLRNTHIINRDTSFSLKAKMSIGTDGAATRIIPLDYPIPPVNGIFSFDDFIVLNAGDVVNWTGETGNLIAYLSGIEISPIPSGDALKRWGPVQGSGISTTVSLASITGAGIIRNIIAVNNDTVPRSFRLYYREAATSLPGIDFLPSLISPYIVIPARGVFTWSGYQVTAAGGAFNIRAETPIVVIMNGLELI